MPFPSGNAAAPLRRAPAALAVALLAAACSDGPTALDAPAAEAKASLAVIAENPRSGDRLSGVVTFRARVEGRAPSQYRMVWTVDHGQENAMLDAGGGEEAVVDLASWTWRGEGPYRVTFRAYDAGRGRRLGETTVDLYVTDATAPPPPPAVANPFAGVALWVDPGSNARRTADAWRATRPADAAAMDVLAERPQVDWFGDWSGDVRAAVAARVGTIVGAGALPVLVAYNVPVRDCSSYSGGGATSGAAYRAWIRELAAGLGGHAAAVVLEPDALAQLDCLTAAQQGERLALLSDAVGVLTAAGAAVYLDAGHARWHSADVIAARLLEAGVAGATGFALNVSNFVASDESVAYGRVVAGLVGGKGFVIDTSRNGLGPDAGGEWCNPSGRALGTAATGATGVAGVDAFLYVKRPGESDGSCNGGPTAGAWWAEYALGLVQRAGGGATVASLQN